MVLTFVASLHRRRDFSFALIFASLVLVSCGGSSSSSVANLSNNSIVDTTNTTVAPDTTNATISTLALQEFGTYYFADTHIQFVRSMMSQDYNNQVADIDIISAAQNVCNQIRTRGLDAWVKEVDSKRNTDSIQDWRVRVASTIGAATIFCYEFKDEIQKHPIASGW